MGVSQAHGISSGYAALDLETTGLDARTDRIVEIGVVLLDEQGNPEREWDSLVNPLRPMGATEIHGVHAAEVAQAPSFSQLLPHVERLLHGRILVAHNARFDLGFLNEAFRRAGSPLRIPLSAAVCTMDLSRIYVPEGRHSLMAVARRAGIEIEEHHRAITDARMCGRLLAEYLRREARGERYATSAHSRDGREITAAAWDDARRHAAEIIWPTPLFEVEFPGVRRARRESAAPGVTPGSHATPANGSGGAA
ncbi:3'-5' exonuclease [Actinotignum sp. GS-2025a]|uniref:3'-5' exonuclease n=1 Tax=Actinotignum sp. GS-2025a TaxID=3427274 RepID=UPI003F44E9F2